MKTISYFLAFLALSLLAPCTAPCREEADFVVLREHMVREQIAARGVRNSAVLNAMLRVPRHLFVPESQRVHSYGDHALPIGEGQTISQPYVVAFMTEALGLKPGDRVLEIGTGSGYQAAVLAELVKEVYTIELIRTLGERAASSLTQLGYKNVRVRIGDGYKGWPEAAPFDAVIVTCAPERVPEALVDQLKEGGTMMIPVGKEGAVQHLVRGVKRDGKLTTENVMYVRFVPMVKESE
jgi:protein-L-isoaspartate(D-aspartate) O-methyltransferase